MTIKHIVGFGLALLLVAIAVISVALPTANQSPVNTEISQTPTSSVLSGENINNDAPSPEVASSSAVVPVIQETSVLTQNNNQAKDAAMSDSGRREVITLAGGCFWCSEAFMQETPGVVDVISGYAGGSQGDANYKTVSGGKTAHREAVQVTFDPQRVSIDQILDVYWAHIDPTDEGGQFADRGFQYTTAIFYHTSEQKIIAEASFDRLSKSGLFSDPIATFIIPYSTFYRAEEYHQDYYKKAADHYERYKKGSGRAGFVEENWAKAAALEFLESEN